jgi:autophagy-related protein 17
MAATDSYPENLTNTISTIKNSLPIITALPSIDNIIQSQVEVSTHMASHLESLASHYDQMAGALRESEAGEVFSEEDLQGRCDSLWTIEWIVKLFFMLQDMNRDTDELPSIMAELEDSIFSIESS